MRRQANNNVCVPALSTTANSRSRSNGALDIGVQSIMQDERNAGGAQLRSYPEAYELIHIDGAPGGPASFSLTFEDTPMNCTLLTAGQETHIRFVAVALSIAIVVAWIAIALS
jgi:hypothetical protein